MVEIGELFTTRKMQELLQVDRSTIYRMAESGRLPAIKVGKQWRFPAAEVERWLQGSVSESPAESAARADTAGRTFTDLVPLECVQLVQDAFAEVIGAQMIVTDLDGVPITRSSNPSPLFELLSENDQEHTICSQTWAELGQTPVMAPEFVSSAGGLLCARAFVRIGNELKAMVIIFSVAPESWPPAREVVDRLSELVEIPAGKLSGVLETAYSLSPEKKEQALVTIQRMANILSHVGNERAELLDRLASIAELSKT